MWSAVQKTTNAAGPQRVILYDGECGLCDRLVHWVLQRDRTGVFRFAALQSDWAQGFLQSHQMPMKNFDSMVLIEGEKIFLRSDAVLQVLRHLPRWRWAYGFIVLPHRLRDAIYAWVARRRKKWFPAPVVCGVPQPEWLDRFIA
jgi:predicted DCC family thiol-disulfide oxidoreductase YuxK